MVMSGEIKEWPKTDLCMNVFGHEAALMLDSGPTLHILVKVFKE